MKSLNIRKKNKKPSLSRGLGHDQNLGRAPGVQGAGGAACIAAFAAAAARRAAALASRASGDLLSRYFSIPRFATCAKFWPK